MDYTIDYQRILDCIPVSETSRDEWVRVGMALKEEGQPFEMFDDWSSQDTRDGQYRGTQYTAYIWDSFQGGSGDIVTGATLTEMARSYGFDPFVKTTSSNEFFGWDDEITSNGEESEPIKARSYQPSPSLRPSKKAPFQIIDYLEACFKPDDYINILTSSYFNEEREKYEPKGLGLATITVEEYVQDLRRAAEKSDFFDEVFGSYDHQAGAWIRVNSVTGRIREGQKGLSDRDVARFDQVLIESDVLSIDEQLEKIKELNLPYKALVYSGGKSIHAIVRIDAKNAADYKDRVNWLYDYCDSMGFPVDEQDKNPSRLTRLPGVERGEQKQLLIETAKPVSFDEFKALAIAEQEAEKMDVVCLADVYESLPPLNPELIEGVIRRGHKMLISGSSKAGKSFALIELAIAIAEGREWLGFPCKQGKVLYFNFEIDGNSFLNRMATAYQALGWPVENAKNIQIMNLRGRAEPLNEFTPKIEAWLKKHPVDLVIIDPIYKVITGDENSASDMGKFCNLFDRIAESGQCTVAYCHHHSKGSQANKQVIDRASGSGVFARDPDAIIDMTEIGFSEGERSELKAILTEMVDDAYLKSSGQWDNLARVHPEDLTNRLAKQLAVNEDIKLNPHKEVTYKESYARAEELGSCPAFRVSFVLREFKSPEDRNIFFQYPLHIDDPTGYLSKLYLVGDNSFEKLNQRKEKADKRRSDKKREWYEEQRQEGNAVSISDMADYFECTLPTIRKWADDQEDLKRENGWILKKDEAAPPKKQRGKGK